ncbi:MAG: hypothetical protein V4555_13870, partial [Acidobacteriota bacterium]
MTRPAYIRLTGSLLAAWFLAEAAAAQFGWLGGTPGQPPIQLLAAVLIPLGAIAAGCVSSSSFRSFLLSLSPKILTQLQAWRVGGFVFLVLARYAILPPEFALSAGWGDITIGATATLVALRLSTPQHKTSFVIWQILGITDLIVAVSLGATTNLFHPHSIPTTPMSVLPLSLIPTFAVPLLLVVHIICIAQALRWKQPSTESPLP